MTEENIGEPAQRRRLDSPNRGWSPPRSAARTSRAKLKSWPSARPRGCSTSRSSVNSSGVSRRFNQCARRTTNPPRRSFAHYVRSDNPSLQQRRVHASGFLAVSGRTSRPTESHSSSRRTRIRRTPKEWPSSKSRRRARCSRRGCVSSTHRGCGFVFAGNSAVTRGFVPHIDAAIVVVGANRPISGDEMDLVADILARNVRGSALRREQGRSHQRHRAPSGDRFSGPDRRKASWADGANLRSRRDGAAAGLGGVRLAGAEGRAARAGWGTGADLVGIARQRGLALLADQLLHEIDEQHGALSRPIAESEQRIAELKRCAADAEVSLRELGHRMTAEQERLNAIFVQRREAFLSDARREARRALAASLAATSERGTALRKRAVAVGQDLSKQWIEPRLRDEQATADELYRDSMRRFVDMANAFLVSSAAMGTLATPMVGDGFQVKSRFFPHELLTVVPESFWTRIADGLRRARVRSPRSSVPPASTSSTCWRRTARAFRMTSSSERWRAG